MAIAQSSYLARAVTGRPGMPAAMNKHDADSRNVETADGIGFGLAVSQGAAARGAILGGSVDGFIGVSVQDVTLVSFPADKCPQNHSLGVASEGDWFVLPSTSVTPASPVHFNEITGRFSGSGNAGPISGARWMTTALADGLAVLRLSRRPFANVGIYTAQAVAFDGATLLKRTGLVGTPGGSYTLSLWARSRYDGASNRPVFSFFQANGTDTGAQGIGGTTLWVTPDEVTEQPLFMSSLETQDDEFGIYSAGVSKWKPGIGPALGNSWHHFLARADYSEGGPNISELYIDDVVVAMQNNYDDGVNPMILNFFERTFYMPDWMIVAGTQPPKQDMADVWIAPGVSLDLSVDANRRKFISAAGKPVDLGANGELPTGSPPTIFFSGDKDAFPVNKGTGGAFTLVGALTDADSRPSD